MPTLRKIPPTEAASWDLDLAPLSSTPCWEASPMATAPASPASTAPASTPGMRGSTTATSSTTTSSPTVSSAARRAPCAQPSPGAIPRATGSARVVNTIRLDPPSPNILTFGQDVNLTFNYATTQAGGVRIFARPFANGALAPNYAASGSPLYPIGSGAGSGSFAITSGDVSVDQIRFQVLNAAQSQLLFEAFIPVHYQYERGQNYVVYLPLVVK